MIQRADGKSFRSVELKEIVGLLAYFLSFCRGLWVAPILLVGFNKEGTRDWEEWRDWSLERWQTASTWVNKLSTECLSDSFAGFVRALKNDVWAEPIRLSLWWYLASNLRAGGLEGSIVLVQVAIELLAWTYLVEESKTLGEKQFGKISAAEKLRRLLSAAKISLEVPKILPELSKLALSSSWKDGPEALTKIRNGLVHPLPTKRRAILDAPPIAVYEATSLSLWYLEMLLLWIIDYRGKYSNGLMREVFRGEEVMQVPWAKN